MTIWKDIPETYTVRPPTMADIPAVTQMVNRASVAMTGVARHTENELSSEWTLPGPSLAEDKRLVLDGNRPVGLVEVWAHRSPPVVVWVWGRVDPDYEGQGIGTAMMRWAEARGRESAFPRVEEGLQITLQCGTEASYAPAIALLTDLGMVQSRSFWHMRASLSEPIAPVALPEGLVMRTLAETNELEPVIHAVRDAFRDHWGHHDSPWEEELAEWKHWIETNEDFDPSLCFVAMDGEEIAAVSLGLPKSANDPLIGYVDTLGVRPAWRRRGLGLALLRHSFAEFQQRGKTAVDLHVDAASPTGATRLYEQAGMTVYQANQNFEKVLRPGKDITYRESFEGEALLTAHAV